MIAGPWTRGSRSVETNGHAECTDGCRYHFLNWDPQRRGDTSGVHLDND